MQPTEIPKHGPSARFLPFYGLHRLLLFVIAFHRCISGSYSDTQVRPCTKQSASCDIHRVLFILTLRH